MLCICKPFLIGFNCILAQYGNGSIQTLSLLLVENSMVVTVRGHFCRPTPPGGWWDPHREHGGTGSLDTLSLPLCALRVWRDFSLGCHSGFQ